MGVFNVAAKAITFTPSDGTLFNVAASADDWVDTDVSATLGTNTTRVHVFCCYTVGSGIFAGVRPHGSANTPKAPIGAGAGTFMSQVDSSGHVDFKRDAAQGLAYRWLGYFTI